MPLVIFQFFINLNPKSVEDLQEWALPQAEGQQFHYLNLVPGQPVFENSTEMPTSTTTTVEADNATTSTSSTGSASQEEEDGFSLFGPMNAKALFNIMGDIED